MDEKELKKVEEATTNPTEDNNEEFLNNYTPEFKPGQIAPRSITDEMKANYIDYSMSVIVSRALPEIKDGLKPSQRRILVAMNDLNLIPSAHYRKSAKIAGDTSGNYHPHGEAVIYPTMVKLAQEFATRYPLIDGQGNFGSIDGDPPAAMRYTESKMTKITVEMLKDLEKGTVTYLPNYDGTRLEPTILPAAFPQLLANGSDGIAVGMATKIPPHNLGELITALRAMIKAGNSSKDAPIYNELRLLREKTETIPMTLDGKPENYLDNYLHKEDTDYTQQFEALKQRLESGEVLYPEFKSELTPEDLIAIIPGPDFPTGSTIYNRQEILNVYSTGRGKILQRAKASIEENSKGRFEIVVTEIPYQVNKAYLIEKIADLVKEKKVEGIADIRDESNIEGMRVVIVLKKDGQPKAVLNKLYKYTEMQKVFSANMIALVEQEPKTLTLKHMLELFLSFRISVVVRRFEFDLAQDRYRAHILEGLLKALDIIDEIITTIRKSKTQEESKENLMTKFEFTSVQAQAILDMQLRKLAALEREKLQDEFKEVSNNIDYYTKTLADQTKILEVIDNELEEINKAHADERRTKVIKGKIDEISEEDMVAAEDTLVTISHEGYIKRVNPSVYKLQNRGGKGVVGATTKQDDWVEHALLCNTHDDLMLFSNQGRVFKIRVFEVPEYGRTAKGLPLVNLIQLQQGELVTSLLTMSKEGKIGDKGMESEGDQREYKYLFMATRKGTVKKTDISEFEKIRSNGLIAAKLEDGDQLLWVKPTTGNDDILLASMFGKCIRFAEKGVRPTGRATMGVRGIKMSKAEDNLISMDVVTDNNGLVFSLSQKGYGKMTKLDQYAQQGRGGQGVFTFKVNPKTGNLIVNRVVANIDVEMVVISEGGQVIKTPLKAIPVLLQRQTSGVKVMTLYEGDSVAALALL
ncbi:DNA gyrase subunit A [bacterium]|nr:DNA gyrase subunit A [bacterium]